MNMKYILVLLLSPMVVLMISSCKKDPPAQQNYAPVANAGADITITLPTDSVELNGAGTDIDGHIAGYYWKQLAGPSSVTGVNQLAATTKVKNLAEGVYEFELLAYDNRGDIGRDTVAVFVVLQDTLQGINTRLISIGRLSKKRDFAAAATVGNKILFAGGSLWKQEKDFPLFSRVDIYDISTQTWSIAELSEARTGIGAIAVGNKVLFAGGAKYFDWDIFWQNLSARVDIYDASTNSWTTTELPESELFQQGFGVTASAGNKAIFYSDYWIIDLNIPHVYFYDVNTNTWSTDRLSENYNKTYVAAASFENKALFAGGHYGFKGFPPYYSKTVDIYHADSNTWTVDSLSEGTPYIAGGVLNNKAFFATGWGSGNLAGKVDIYDNASQTWTTANLSSFTSPGGVASSGQRICFFGDKRVDIYDESSDTWSIADLPVSLYGSAFIAAGGNIYATNGEQVWRVEL